MYEENTLSHHGIKGQKWGVRRFQNSDGSLTDEGKRRYNKAAYEEIVTRTALGRSVSKGKLVNEIVDDISPYYLKVKKSIDRYNKESDKVRQTETYKKELLKERTDPKNEYAEIVINGKSYYAFVNEMKSSLSTGAYHNIYTKKGINETIEEKAVISAGKSSKSFEKAKKDMHKNAEEYSEVTLKKIEDLLGAYQNRTINNVSLQDRVYSDITSYLKNETVTIPNSYDRKQAKKLITKTFLQRNNPIFKDYDEE